MGAIKINGETSGSTTITAPATGSDESIELSTALASKPDRLDLGRGITSSITLDLSDAFTVLTITGSTGYTVTVPPDSSVNFPVGSVVEIWQQSAAQATLAAGSGVTLYATTLLTPGTHLGLRLLKLAANAWWVTPFSDGVGAANFSDAATGTYTDSGVTWKYKTYSSTSTLTITKAGLIDILALGGGGGGAYAGGGGGGTGHMWVSQRYIPAGTYTVVVGAGGPGSTSRTAAGGTGGESVMYLSSFVVGAFGGGGAGATDTTKNGLTGGCGGGGSGGGADGSAAGFGGPALGITAGSGGGGGNSTAPTAGQRASGGGGGYSANGGNATSNQGGAGGGGFAWSVTGTSVTYGGGGGGGSFGTGGAGGAGGGGAGQTGNNAGGNGTAFGAGGGGGGLISGAGGVSVGGNGGNGFGGAIIVRVRT